VSGAATGAVERQQRELGFWTCTALIVGNVIGMGIFVLPASLAPYGFNALLGWGVTVLGMLVLARVFARLASTLPNADGPFAYIQSQLGEPVAFLAIWCYWVSLWITNAALAIGIVAYLGAIVPGLGGIPPLLLSLALLWVFVGVSLRGMHAGGRVQVVTTLLKLLPMAAVIGLGLWILLSDPAAYSRTPPTTPLSLDGLMAASTIALFAMLGIESASVPAGRVRDAARTIPRATMVGTILVAVIYLAVSAIPMLLVPQAELAESSAPFALLLERELGAGAGRWLAVFVVISGLGALNGWTLLVGELTRSMSAHGVLPAGFAKLNARGAPVLALLITGVLASAMVAMNYSKSLVQGFTFLTLVVTGANLPLYLFCAAALAVLKLKAERPASRDLLVLGVLGIAYSIFAFIGLGREPFLWALALAAAGVPVYLWMRRRR
jgi:APA family basic amino acid/polyamine antiporter